MTPFILVTLCLLFTAHFVGDFVLQSNWMGVQKSKDWNALAAHVLVYEATLLAFGLLQLAWMHHLEFWWSVLTFVSWNGVAHFAQDAVTSRITARLWFLKNEFAGCVFRKVGFGNEDASPTYWVDDTGTRHAFFLAIGADQLLHAITLLVTFWWWRQ